MTKKKYITTNKVYKDTPAQYKGGNASRHNGIYIAVVKKSYDPQKMGRLLAWVPDLGGLEDDESYWKSFSYASPFAGQSPAKPEYIQGTTFESTPVAYGMWFVPPDEGNKIVVAFLDGDENRGIWFGALQESYMNHSMPDIAFAKSNKTGHPLERPVTEYNKHETVVNPHEPAKGRPEHTPRFNSLVEAGLIRDFVRGPTTSNAQRETPSQVFGMNTPGPIDATLPNAAQVKKRHGGHSLVFDDGDIRGTSELVRLRTRGGHQILLHDSAELIYISNKESTAWVELDNRGNISIYGKGEFSVRSEGNMNLHTDKNLNIGVDGNLNVNVGGNTRINQNGTMDHRIGGAIKETFASTRDTKITGDVKTEYEADYDLTVGTETTINTGTQYNVRAGRNIRNRALGGEFTVISASDFVAKSANVHLNPSSTPASPNDADSPAEASKVSLKRHKNITDPLEALSPGSHSNNKTSPTSTFPTMEPWVGHKTSSSSYSFTNSAAAGNPIQENTSNRAETSIEGNAPAKTGAISSVANKPLDYENAEGKFVGTGYDSAGNPQYEKIEDSLNETDATAQGKPQSRFEVNGMTISDNGLKFVMHHEGFKKSVYKDVALLPTIGVGHLLLPEENQRGAINIGGTFIKPPLTDDQVMALLRQDLVRFIKSVQEACKTELTQNQFDACVSLSFNIGVGGFKKSSVVKRINSDDFPNVPDAFMMWTKATINGQRQVIKGLVNRRRAEVDLFTKLSSTE